MFGLFPEHPNAFYNTLRIAEMVDLNFKFGNPLLPKFDVPRTTLWTATFITSPTKV